MTNNLRDVFPTCACIVAIDVSTADRAADSGQIDMTSSETSSVSLTIPGCVTFAIETVTEINAETGELSLPVIGDEFDQLLTGLSDESVGREHKSEFARITKLNPFLVGLSRVHGAGRFHQHK